MARPDKRDARKAAGTQIAPDVSRLGPLLHAPRLEQLTRVIIPCVVIAITFFAFLPVRNAEFLNWDDDMNFRENPSFRGLSPQHVAWMFQSGYMGHYQPLSWLTLALDYERSGGLDHPEYFHRTNIALHALTAFLFYLLSRRLLRLAFMSDAPNRGGAEPSSIALCLSAGVAAIFFAAHPLRVESVAWVTERRDVLSGAFFVGSLLAYLRAVTPGKIAVRSHAWHMFSVLLALLSLLSKAWGMALPLIMLVLDLYPIRRVREDPNASRTHQFFILLYQKIPFILLSLFAGVTAIMAQRTVDWGVMSLTKYSLSSRLAQALYGIAYYPLRTLLPQDLATIYQIPKDLGLDSGPVLLGAIVTFAITAVLVALWRRFPAGLAVWLCYLVTVAPVLGVAQSGMQIVADRYSYLACLGIPLLVAGGLLWLWVHRHEGLTAAFYAASSLAVLAAIVLACLTYHEAGYWKTSISLWTRTVRIAPESFIAWINFGNARFLAGDKDGALDCGLRAIKLNPESGNAWQLLGSIYNSLNRFEEAEHAFQQARAYYNNPLHTDLELGWAYVRWGKYDQAIPLLSSAMTESKYAPFALLYLGLAHRRQGRFELAAREMEQAFALEPKLAKTYSTELEKARQRR